MIRLRLLALGAVVLATLVWAACVGETATPNDTKVGEQGGACLDGGACLAGLVCVHNTCVTSSASGTSSSGGSSSSSSSSGEIADGGADADAGAKPVSCEDLGDLAYPRCPDGPVLDTCAAGKAQCCPGGGCGTAADTCDPYNGLFVCFGTDACRRSGGSNVCCVTAKIKDAGGACPSAPNVLSKDTATITRCATSCDTGEVRLCDQPDGGQGSCPSGQKCELATVKLADGIPQIVAVCTKP